jgi:hypothetical protein
MVSNIAWSGEGPLTYPAFPISDGLTSRAIATKKTVNVGEVANDADYLPALATTRSEIIIPVLDAAGECVLGTVDVESEQPHAFDFSAQVRLEEFARLLRPFGSADQRRETASPTLCHVGVDRQKGGSLFRCSADECSRRGS